MDSSKMKVVYTVVENKQGKSFWMRIGVGFHNHDGSLNLRLDALPINGSIQVRDFEPRDERRGEFQRASPPPLPPPNALRDPPRVSHASDEVPL